MDNDVNQVDSVATPPVAESKPVQESFRDAVAAELAGVASAAGTAAASPVESAPAPVAPAKSRVIAEYLKKQYEADLSDEISDEELAPQIGHILESHQILEQRLAERERQLSEYLASRQEFDEFRASQAQARQLASQEQKPLEPKVKPLVYDRDWEHLATLDKDTGLWTPKAKFGLQGIEAAEKLNQYQREQADRARRLVSDPLSLIREAGLEQELKQLEERILKQIEEKVNSIPTRLKQEASARQAEGEVAQWIQSRERDLMVHDAMGRPVLRAGQPALTEKGMTYQRAAVEAREVYGIQDARLVHRYAAERYERAFPEKAPEPVAAPAPVVAPAAPTPTAQEKGEELKKKFLEKGRVTTSTPSGATESGATPGKPFTPRFRELVREELASQGRDISQLT